MGWDCLNCGGNIQDDQGGCVVCSQDAELKQLRATISSLSAEAQNKLFQAVKDRDTELTRLRARIEELEAVCQSLQEDVGHAMATANHREDQRAAAVDRYKQAEQRVEELERVAEERLMRAARAEASRAVLMQAMVDRARMGYGEWARQWIGKADSAAKDVRREDLVVATVNSAALDAAEG